MCHQRVPRRNLITVLMFAAAVAACGDPSSHSLLAPAGAPSLLEAPVSGVVGQWVHIDLPGDVTYDVTHSYVTKPSLEVKSDVAEIGKDPHSQIVQVECKRAGDAWVRVFTSNGAWKIYPLTCKEPEFEDYISRRVGREFYFDVPGGTVQNAYISVPYSETISGVATLRTQSNEVYVLCKVVGTAWIKVLTGNGYWKIYALTCEPEHDQGGGG